MKPHLYTSIRNKYNLPTNENNFFTKKEMQHIVSAITGQEKNWTHSDNYMNDYLNKYGWANQKTIDSHPSILNLNLILNVKKMKNQKQTNIKQICKNDNRITLNYLLKQISNEFLSEMKSATLKERTLTITF